MTDRTGSPSSSNAGTLDLPSQALMRWERLGLWALFAVTLLFGVLVTYRSAFLSRRMGDATMLFRAGWSARAGGEKLYKLTSDSGLNYHYPPGFALLMMPFADAPPGAEAFPAPPFAVSVALWYVINLGFLAVGIHYLALALEEVGGQVSMPFSRRWWVLRALPLAICLPCVGSTLNQGQVTILLFTLISLALASLARGRSFTAGMWFAGAAAIKIFPAYLGLIALSRWNARCVLGWSVGLILGLAVVPAVAYGPALTLKLYSQLEDVLLEPALGVGNDRSRMRQLFSMRGPHSQSFLSAASSFLHWSRTTRPHQAPGAAIWIHLLVAAVLTSVTLWVFRPLRGEERQMRSLRVVLLGATLTAIMPLMSPACHLHYLMFALPLVQTLTALARGDAVYPSRTVLAAFGVHLLTVILAQLPGLEILKDKCLPMAGVLLLWFVSCQYGWKLRCLSQTSVSTEPKGEDLRLAA